MKLTPVLLVENVEASLEFWEARMGWQKVVEVPHGDAIGFALLVQDGSELMLQTFASVAQDAPQFNSSPGQCRSSLFIEVTDWDDTLRRLHGYPIALPERVTFYGMREIGVFDPGGNVAVFAIKTEA